MAAAPLRIVPSSSSSEPEPQSESQQRSESQPLESQQPFESLRGRIVELCGGPSVARTSVAVALCVEAQAKGDPVAWVLPRALGASAVIYPPDLADAGLDLEALVVVHVPGHDERAGPRAAEILLRTGGFGAVVLDLSSLTFARQGARSDAWMGRLLGLAREHATQLVMLSSSDARAPSLGPLVSLRMEMRRTRLSAGRFRVESRVLKDKSGVMKGEEERVMRGPVGLA